MSRKLCVVMAIAAFMGMEILATQTADAQMLRRLMRRRSNNNCCCESATCGTCATAATTAGPVAYEGESVAYAAAPVSYSEPVNYGSYEAAPVSYDSYAAAPVSYEAAPVSYDSYEAAPAASYNSYEAAPIAASEDCGCASAAPMATSYVAEAPVQYSPMVADTGCGGCSGCGDCGMACGGEIGYGGPVAGSYVEASPATYTSGQMVAAPATYSEGCVGCGDMNVAPVTYEGQMGAPTSDCGCGGGYADGGYVQGGYVEGGYVDGGYTEGGVVGCQGEGCNGVSGVIYESGDSVPVEAPTVESTESTTTETTTESTGTESDTPPAAPSEEATENKEA